VPPPPKEDNLVEIFISLVEIASVGMEGRSIFSFSPIIKKLRFGLKYDIVYL
jgi:hypothetical protein